MTRDAAELTVPRKESSTPARRRFRRRV